MRASGSAYSCVSEPADLCIIYSTGSSTVAVVSLPDGAYRMERDRKREGERMVGRREEEEAMERRKERLVLSKGKLDDINSLVTALVDCYEEPSNMHKPGNL